MIEVSYVVPVYDKEAFLPHVIESLRRQEGDFTREHIFVDDGSTDDSARLLREAAQVLANTRILTQENQGPAFATNAGLAAACGRYTKLLDGDDVLAPKATAALLAAAKSSGAGFVLGDEGPAYRPGAPFPFPFPFTDAGPVPEGRGGVVRVIEDGLALAIRGTVRNPSCMLFETEVARAVGGCDQRVFLQDYSLTLRLAAVTRLACIGQVVTVGPDQSPGRLSADAAQALHDSNRALALFFAGHLELPLRYRRQAARRAMGRAWKWAHRHEGASLLSPYCWAYAASLLPLPAGFDALLALSCRPFRQSKTLRIPDVNQ
jgi:GT2 family glycosyltransferase